MSMRQRSRPATRCLAADVSCPPGKVFKGGATVMNRMRRLFHAPALAILGALAITAPALAVDVLDTHAYAGNWRLDAGTIVADGQVICAPINGVLDDGGQLVEIERASRDLIRMTVTRRSASGGRALDGPYIVSIASEDGRVVMTRPGRRDEVFMEGADAFRLLPLDGGNAQIFRRCP